MAISAPRALPAGAVLCNSAGRCGDNTGWHHPGSDAQQRCDVIAGRIAESVEQMRRGTAAGIKRTSKEGHELRPLRRLEHDEFEMFDAMRQNALRFLPFYSHLAHKVKPVAVDEEPWFDSEGNPHWELRAGVDANWRLLINFDWVRHEFESAYEKHGEAVRKSIGAAGLTPDEESVRQGCDFHASMMMSKVLLHELGHVMYNTFDLPEKEGLDSDTLNRAEDCVINNALRVLGAPKHGVSNDDISGMFLENAMYGGGVECDDPEHSWVYTDPKTGEKSRRCSYEETTKHYYALIEKKKKEEQNNPSGGGSESNEGAPAPNGDAGGQAQGKQGQSEAAGRGEGGPSEGGDRGKAQSDGESDGCGRAAADKYADDPLDRDEVSDQQKENSLNVHARDIEEWAKENEDRAKRAGFGAGTMARKWANNRRKTDGIKWNQLLNRTARQAVESHKRKRRTYAKPNRRNAANPKILRRGTKPGYLPSVATAVDTSGSMSADDLFAAYNSIHSVMRRSGIRSVDAYAVDSEAKSRPIAIKKAEDLAPLLQGGGGTDMCVGIEVAAANGNDVCVVFTDGEVPWGKLAQRPKHIPHMDVIIGIISDDKGTYERLAAAVPPWMKAVNIDKGALSARNAKSEGPFLG